MNSCSCFKGVRLWKAPGAGPALALVSGKKSNFFLILWSNSKSANSTRCLRRRDFCRFYYTILWLAPHLDSTKIVLSRVLAKDGKKQSLLKTTSFSYPDTVVASEINGEDAFNARHAWETPILQQNRLSVNFWRWPEFRLCGLKIKFINFADRTRWEDFEKMNRSFVLH